MVLDTARLDKQIEFLETLDDLKIFSGPIQ